MIEMRCITDNYPEIDGHWPVPVTIFMRMNAIGAFHCLFSGAGWTWTRFMNNSQERDGHRCVFLSIFWDVLDMKAFHCNTVVFYLFLNPRKSECATPHYVMMSVIYLLHAEILFLLLHKYFRHLFCRLDTRSLQTNMKCDVYLKTCVIHILESCILYLPLIIF